MKYRKKICCHCKKEKNVCDFYKNNSTNDGLSTECKECIKLYYINNKTKILKYHKLYNILNKEKIKRYREINKEKLKIKCALYRKKNKTRISKQHTDYHLNRLKTDINYKLAHNLRGRIWHALKNNIKSIHTIELLGCSIDFLKQHLESQFKPGMSWNNYGFYGWHIDHIKPCIVFDLSKPEEQRKCFHYTNLQPLWAEENIKKRDNDKKQNKQK
jgi:hypothetical protein